ncbi:Uncharacterized protein FWK35_00004062 [Aphis craccivora]|uniref:Uncharacterized protein n=1 Tax=Aphis craccivora TaxID=307492 RepID=A0A6G0Z2L0_APHCR|nr:Uncharacterized protein FWK35_00004062 [Aphis craccivora]
MITLATVNFGGAFGWQSEYPWCIIEVKSNKIFQQFSKKIEKNEKSDRQTGIFTVDKIIVGVQKNLEI